MVPDNRDVLLAKDGSFAVDSPVCRHGQTIDTPGSAAVGLGLEDGRVARHMPLLAPAECVACHGSASFSCTSLSISREADCILQFRDGARSGAAFRRKQCMDSPDSHSGELARLQARPVPPGSASRGSARVLTLTTIAVLTLAACTSSGLNEVLPTLDLPANDPSFRSRIYAGVGIGSSNLKPDTSDTVFTVGDGGDSASNLRLGVDVHNLFALELESAVLGAAQLREANADVSFSTLSVSALAYGLNGVQLRSRREGWSAYGRFGFTQTSKSSQVLTLDQGGTTPHVGVGVEYGFPSGLGIRGELTRYSDEAQSFGLAAVYRFGAGPRELGRLLADVTEDDSDSPTVASNSTQYPVAVPSRRFGSDGEGKPEVARLGAALPTEGAHVKSGPRRVAQNTRASGPDRDADGITDRVDQCPTTHRGVAVDARGCGLFDAVLTDVTFKPGSQRLTARARGALDSVARKLLAFPEVRVEVRAHTDSEGAADENLALSARRAEAVIEYLTEQGIAEFQLASRGMGEAQPLASNATADGRKRNRRVELVTLASLDLAALNSGVRSFHEWQLPLVRNATDILNEIDDASTSGQTYATPATVVTQAAAAAANKAAEQTADSAAIETTNEVTQEQQPPAKHTEEPVVAAALPTTPENRRPPLEGLRLAPLPAPAFLAGFDAAGVVEGLRFAVGSDELTGEGKAALGKVRRALKQHPSAHVAVMAHTDNTGDSKDNQVLSERRAQRVVDELVASGISKSRLVAEGYGDKLPLVQNVSERNRARNRRVEIRVIRTGGR